jgi:pantothenate kinase
MMQKTPHKLLTGMNPQINVQLIKENVPATINQLQQLVEARQLAQSHLEHIQKAKDNKMP